MDTVELGRTPISKQSPTGEDIRLDPLFEELAGHFERMSSPSSAGTINWDRIVTLASEILADHSKDLLVACYLSIGLLEKNGLKGMAVGLHIIHDLMTEYWETMYPPLKRIRGRISALEWWLEKTEIALLETEPVSWTAEVREGFFRDLSTIDEFIAAHISNGPTLFSVQSKLLELVTSPEEVDAEADVPEPMDSIPAVKPPKPEPVPTQQTPLTAPIPAAPSPSPESSTDDTDKLLRQGLELLGTAASALMKRDPFDPLMFRLNRIVAWIPVKSAPPETDGRTLLPPPDTQVIASLKSLRQSRNWRELIIAAESRVRQHLFWFDLHRLVAEALENLRYPDIAAIIAGETAAFTERMHGIERFAFSDGTPFADQETRNWLKTSTSPEIATSIVSGNDTLGKTIAEESVKAQELLASQKLGHAFSLFRDHMNHSVSIHDRFCWEIAYCQLLLKAKQPRLAIPGVAGLLSAIDMHHLEQWDPALALEGLATILTTLKQQDEHHTDIALAERIIDRIAAIDPTRALEFL